MIYFKNFLLKIFFFAIPIILAINFSYTVVNRDSSFPYISGDSFRSIADYAWDEDICNLKPELVKYKDVIFIKTDYLDIFFQEIHPLIKNKYILITHNSDRSAPNGKGHNFENYLEDEKVLIWFGENPSVKNHRKFIPIPIGIANQCWQYGQLTNFTNILNKSKSSKDKIYLVAMNFKISTNVQERNGVFEYFKDKPFCTQLYSENNVTYLKNMSQAKFTLSPIGNGLDCYRTWEALLMGSIPIVKTSFLDSLFEGLPVLIIKDWPEVTEDFLNQKYLEISSKFKEYNFGKIYFDYWQRLVEYYRNNL